MSSSLGESMSWSTSVACVWVCLVCLGSVVNGLLVFELDSIRLNGRVSKSRDAFELPII